MPTVAASIRSGATVQGHYQLPACARLASHEICAISPGAQPRSISTRQSRSVTSSPQIDATYGRLLPDSEEYRRGLVDTS
jgi:hypothetical protein